MVQSSEPDDRPQDALDAFFEADTWRRLNPGLNVVNRELMKDVEVLAIDEVTGNSLEDALVREGYFHVPQMNWGLPIEEMAPGIARLLENRLVPTFCFMYDEYWLLFFKLHGWLTRLLGPDYAMLPDFWAWYVDPRMEQSGWKPHRDKGAYSLFPDRKPKSLSVWIPLTDATTLNGCIYLVPADRDPTYGTPQDNQWRFNYQDVQAMPSPAGGLLCWTQGLVHWGARSNKRAAAPRISLAFEFQRRNVPPFNEPLMPPLLVLSVEDRLLLICKQILQYKHMYPLSPELARFAEKVLRRPPAPESSAP